MTPVHDALVRDAHHRKIALDTRRSFLVQAPAGSGKTELLIQRYLALLATVPRPQLSWPSRSRERRPTRCASA